MLFCIFNYIKKANSLQHRCFPVKFAKILRTSFLQNTYGGCFCHQSRSKEAKKIATQQIFLTPKCNDTKKQNQL